MDLFSFTLTTAAQMADFPLNTTLDQTLLWTTFIVVYLLAISGLIFCVAYYCACFSERDHSDRMNHLALFLICLNFLIFGGLATMYWFNIDWGIFRPAKTLSQDYNQEICLIKKWHSDDKTPSREQLPSPKIEGQSREQLPSPKIEGQSREQLPSPKIEGQSREQLPSIFGEGQSLWADILVMNSSCTKKKTHYSHCPYWLIPFRQTKPDSKKFTDQSINPYINRYHVGKLYHCWVPKEQFEDAPAVLIPDTVPNLSLVLFYFGLVLLFSPVFLSLLGLGYVYLKWCDRNTDALIYDQFVSVHCKYTLPVHNHFVHIDSISTKPKGKKFL